MEQVLSKNKCTGCTACASICPKNAITMVKNEEGFMYPLIDNNKCINCGLCKKTCPVINTYLNSAINTCYVGFSNDEEILKKSSSGGIFSIIANFILQKDGIVIGATMDQNNRLKHIAICNDEELYKLRGSKYLQSDLNNVFCYIKDNIKEKKILFVGTPCQVAGLKAVVKNNKNLICIDVICHGVPSQKLFEKYIEELEFDNNEKLLHYNFRDKKTGWENYSNTAIFDTKQISQLATDNNYMKLFLSDVALRECCYDCNFKLGNKYSDITLGDFWGIKKYYPEMYNSNGVSAIIINTENGQNIFEEIKDNITYKESNLEYILDGNPSLKNSAKYYKERNLFLNDIDRYSVQELTKKYVKRKYSIKELIKKILKLIKR